VSDPAVSVVVPTYKRPEKLSRAVDSVLSQTVEDWELFVVNDDPDSDVSEVLPDDDRIVYHQHDTNQGAAESRNTGIEMADGQFVAILDDDDTWKPEKLERQLDRFDELGNEYGIVYTGREVVRDSEIISTYHPDASGWIFDELLSGNVIPSETPLIRARCFERVGLFDGELATSPDLDMWIRIAREYKVEAISEPLATSYRGHNNRMGADMDAKYEGLRQLLEKYEDHFEQHPGILAQRYRTLGAYAMNANRMIDARRAYGQSLGISPRQPLVAGYLLLTYMPDLLQRPIVSLRRSIEVYGFCDGTMHWLSSRS
jgi:glycosyltransferase involved in cell wall biosynthesis